MTRHNVIVVGAGAAGLAAARELSGAGLRVCLVEARERIGGRVFTVRTPDLSLPIELGAEFVHGEAPATFAIVDAAPLMAYELPDSHYWSRNGRWTRIKDIWAMIDRVRARIPAGRDQSFADFLEKERKLSARVREIARSFVEGYHASHADRISALAVRDEHQEPSGKKQFRIAGGYDLVLLWLRAGLDPDRVSIRLRTVVTGIEWRRGDVAVRTSGGDELRAQAAIITVPIGVWKAAAGQCGAIRFTPALGAKQRAIARLEVGHVVKIVFRFRQRFWAERGEASFIHSSDPYVPTWWTTAPVRSPLLTAWAGGHAADRLLAEGPDAIVDRALDSLASTFGLNRRRAVALLDAVHMHDWQSDPFSRGAYSYAAVGGSGAHRELARPVSKTLFFAGEATDGEQTGTVAGAISSGRRAARELLGRGTLQQPNK